MINNMRNVLILTASLASGSAFAAVTVPEMDAGAVPLVMGLTLALVVLVKAHLKK